MKKLFYIIMAAFLIAACGHQKTSVEAEAEIQDSIESDSFRYDGKSVIESMCDEFAYDELTPEEIARWDSMNANGGYLLIRGAERHLDTIVNHIHLIFIPEL
jgi:hypothetical protein